MILAVQVVILTLCLLFVVDWIRRFPNPSRITALFLPPEKRWPVAQLWKWVEEGKPDPGFVKFFMRDPDREAPGRGLICPVDGTVLARLTRAGRAYLVISLNVWDVHVARTPCAATVTGIVDHGDMFEPGRDDPLRDEPFYFLRDKASPKQRYLELSTEFGLFRVRFVTSYLSRRIEFFCNVGDELQRGQRIGRMLFGSTCILETDDDIDFSVREGDRVVGGETIVSEGL